MCVCAITLNLPLIICNSLIYPSIAVSAATRPVNGDTRRAMCMLHTRRAHLWFITDSLKSFR